LIVYSRRSTVNVAERRKLSKRLDRGDWRRYSAETANNIVGYSEAKGQRRLLKERIGSRCDGACAREQTASLSWDHASHCWPL